MAVIKIASINVRGIRNRNKRFCIINWLKNNNFDIACLQETYITDEIVEKVEFDFLSLGKIFSSCSDSPHSRGVSLVVSSKIKGLEIIEVNKDSVGRKIMITVKVLDQNKILTIVSAYAPNDITARLAFLEDCSKWISRLAPDDKNIIIAGDFNTCYRQIDRASGKLDKSGNAFCTFMKSLALQDVFAVQNTQAKSFSYIHRSNIDRNSRIDYILRAKHLKRSVIETALTCCPAPDHKAVTLKLNIQSNRRGKGYWKLNNSLLKDELYRKYVTDEIKTTISEYNQHISKQDLLELIKVKVKEISIKYATTKKLKRSNRIIETEYEINTLDKMIASQFNQNLVCKREKLFSELTDLYKADTDGAFVRSRAKWIEKGEKNSSFFLNLEKQHQSFLTL